MMEQAKMEGIFIEKKEWALIEDSLWESIDSLKKIERRFEDRASQDFLINLDVQISDRVDLVEKVIKILSNLEGKNEKTKNPTV
jgi:hypothetical protein